MRAVTLVVPPLKVDALVVEECHDVKAAAGQE